MDAVSGSGRGDVLEFRPSAAGGGDPNFIRVDFARQLETRDVEPLGLFEGFDSIKIVTFSMGVPFLRDVLPLFRECSVVVGCDAIISDTVQRVMAHQSHVFDDVRSDAYLVGRIESGTLAMWVTKDVVAHTKLYLMSSRDGRVRTVVGSANASRRAWNGSQFESYVCFDDRTAYDAWDARFEALVRDASSQIVLEGVAEGPGADVDALSGDAAGDGALKELEALPVVREIKRSRHALVLELDDGRLQELRYEYELKAKAERFEELPPRRVLRRGSATVLDVAALERVRAERRKLEARANARERGLPRFVLMHDAHAATFDGRRLDLDPPAEEVRRDAELLGRFMGALDAFQGDTDTLKTSYYKAITHVFASPFVSRLRFEALVEGLDGYDWNYPAYLLITGERSAGKTKLVSMLHRLMFGCAAIRVRKDCFTPRRLSEVQAQAAGVPILLDEMTMQYFKYAGDIVKDESFLVEEGRTDLPTFVILSNELRKGVNPAVAKRLLHIDVDNKMTPETMHDKNPEVSAIVRQMGTALYRRYLAEMFDVVDAMVDRLRDGSGVLPDPYSASSRTLLGVFDACGVQAPPLMREFTWKECMGNAGNAAKAISIIKTMAERDARHVVVNRRRDEVLISFSDYPQAYREEMMGNLENGVPFTMERTSDALVIHGVKQLESLVGMRLGRRLRVFR